MSGAVAPVVTRRPLASLLQTDYYGLSSKALAGSGRQVSPLEDLACQGLQSLLDVRGCASESKG
jgi:hypothetical protein